MSWLSKGLHKVAKVVSKPMDKTWGALGMGTGNTLRRALDPMSIQLHKVGKGEPITTRMIVDPGNELQAAPMKQGVNGPQINPLTGQPGTNARDLIAQQMSGAPPSNAGRPVVNPGIGNAGSPSYGFGVSNQVPTGPREPSEPLPNYGDIHAIQQYVMGKMSAPGSAPMGAPQKQPMFGGPRRYT
jgi:hypothetical protein